MSMFGNSNLKHWKKCPFKVNKHNRCHPTAELITEETMSFDYCEEDKCMAYEEDKCLLLLIKKEDK